LAGPIPSEERGYSHNISQHSLMAGRKGETGQDQQSIFSSRTASQHVLNSRLEICLCNSGNTWKHKHVKTVKCWSHCHPDLSTSSHEPTRHLIGTFGETVSWRLKRRIGVCITQVISGLQAPDRLSWAQGFEGKLCPQSFDRILSHTRSLYGSMRSLYIYIYMCVCVFVNAKGTWAISVICAHVSRCRSTPFFRHVMGGSVALQTESGNEMFRDHVPSHHTMFLNDPQSGWWALQCLF